MLKWKETFLLLLIITLAISLPLISAWANGMVIFQSLSGRINMQIIYQFITFFEAVVFLLILWRLKTTELQEHFRKGIISAQIIPEPLVGIKPKKNENWLHLGRNFAIIISVVTAIIIYFQMIKNKEFAVENIWKVLPYSIVFALFNSFVEEIMTRLGVVVALKNTLKDRTIPIISAVIFGGVHYFGNPGGVIGVIFAGFLGWLLAKSIIETKGIFWAWFIHFLQDVIIFSALLIV